MGAGAGDGDIAVASIGEHLSAVASFIEGEDGGIFEVAGSGATGLVVPLVLFSVATALPFPFFFCRHFSTKNTKNDKTSHFKSHLGIIIDSIAYVRHGSQSIGYVAWL